MLYQNAWTNLFLTYHRAASLKVNDINALLDELVQEMSKLMENEVLCANPLFHLLTDTSVEMDPSAGYVCDRSGNAYGSCGFEYNGRRGWRQQEKTEGSSHIPSIFPGSFPAPSAFVITQEPTS